MLISLFKKNIYSLAESEIELYNNIMNSLGLDYRLIFSDKYYTAIPQNFTIFHTYYIQQHFHTMKILTNSEDIKYITDIASHHNIYNIKEFKYGL